MLIFYWNPGGINPCLGFIMMGYGADVKIKKATFDLRVTFLTLN